MVETQQQKRRFSWLLLLGSLGLCGLIVILIARPFWFTDRQGRAAPVPSLVTPPSHQTTSLTPLPSAPALTKFIGGFSIESDAEIANAVATGVQITVIYGNTPGETNDTLGAALQAQHMKVLDTLPWVYLHYYECHLDKSCPLTTYPELTSPQAVLSDLSAHLAQVQHNSLVIGYWVLDDWAYPAGSGKDLLVQMNRLIHQYTPGKPSLCGFGGEIPPLPETTFQWRDSTAANFSPEGCDMVGLYIYGESAPAGSYDWSMKSILPAVFASLAQRGWSISREPLVGLPQVFGGTIYGEQWPMLSARDVETASKTYCQHGATGLLYYNWGEQGQSPMTSKQVSQGIKNGIADCREIWK